MAVKEMTSMQRVLTTLGHQEPDRVPLFLLLTMHGAKELGLTLQDYFSQAKYVAEGQLRLRNKYKNDCLYSFFYAPVEVEAWGAEVIYYDAGPPNSGEPLISELAKIAHLESPRVKETACLKKVLEASALMKAASKDEAPIIGVVMSPFSLPVMQLGFEAYLNLILEQPELFNRLMQVNSRFCLDWANAQLEAGATAICYFNPLASPTMVPRDLYLKTGYPVDQQTIAGISGPTATHLASGRGLAIMDELVATGTAVLGTSAEEDLAVVKEACRGRITVLGNLNGLAMAHWTADQASTVVQEAIRKAASGGGFILADNHGEIPFQVSDHVLLAISEAVQKFGVYHAAGLEAPNG